MSLRLFLLFFFVFSSFSFFLAVSLFSSLYLLTRKKKERANKRNYFSCIRLMNFFINMQAVACNAFISRGWLAGREREREKKRKVVIEASFFHFKINYMYASGRALPISFHFSYSVVFLLVSPMTPIRYVLNSREALVSLIIFLCQSNFHTYTWIEKEISQIKQFRFQLVHEYIISIGIIMWILVIVLFHQMNNWSAWRQDR